MTPKRRPPESEDRADLRRRAVERLRARRPEVAEMPADEQEKLIHELEVHQVELEVQNEELRRAQVELAEARDRYHDLYEFAPVGYLTLGPDGVVRDVNLAATAICGGPRGQIIARRFEQIAARDCRDDCYRLLQRSAQDGERRSEEVRLAREDAARWACVEATPISGADGRCEGYRVTLTDITVLRETREQLEQRVAERTAELTRTVDRLKDEVARRTLAETVLRRRSEQLQQLAGELTLAEERERRKLAEILHDKLQQLLVGAKFRLDLLDRSPDDNARQAAAQVIELLDESITISRSLTGELSPPVLHDCGLGPALQWLAEWVQRKHGLAVELDVDESATLESEERRVLLFQAARELLFNVVKHAGTDAAHVRLAHTDGHIELVVRDEGAGFDPEAALPESGPRPGGFGLFSIRERVDLLGGRLEIDSAPGEGSRFAIVVPVGPMEVSGRKTRRAAAAARAGGAPADEGKHERADGEPIRIILADDHVVLRQGLASLLAEEPDLQVVGEASDGREAVELARRLKPDVVLMDVRMPQLDGIEATRRIHEEMPEVRVIGLSMFDEPDRAARMREAGATDYLTKSGPSDSVMIAIRSCVESR